MIKLTNVTALEMVLGMEEVKANAELVEKLIKMKEQFQKKNSTGTKKPSKAQIENEEIKGRLVEFLGTIEEPIQIKEIQQVDEFKDYSNQKISALLKQLVECGTVAKVVEKRVSKFSLNELDNEEE